jgi:hypothetical protein
MAVGKKTGGGSRKGKRNKSTEEIKELLDSRVDFEVVVEKLYELVQGVTVKKASPSGAPIIYTEKPDVSAAKILIEYRYGKPLQRTELTGKDGDELIKQPVINLLPKNGD